MPKQESLKEKWFHFTRFHCKSGAIDVWTGDCASNPNNETKCNVNLNSIEKYFRLNGTSVWCKRTCFRPGFMTFLIAHSEDFDAIEIWDEYATAPLAPSIASIIHKTESQHPYKEPGNRESYSDYNQGWSDACDVLGEQIIKLLNNNQ